MGRNRFLCFVSHLLPSCSTPCHWFFSPQVAIKIIDKTQLNPNSLQKVTNTPPPPPPPPLSLSEAESVYELNMKHNRLGINFVKGKRCMLGRSLCAFSDFIMVYDLSQRVFHVCSSAKEGNIGNFESFFLLSVCGFKVFFWSFVSRRLSTSLSSLGRRGATL